MAEWSLLFCRGVGKNRNSCLSPRSPIACWQSVEIQSQALSGVPGWSLYLNPPGVLQTPMTQTKEGPCWWPGNTLKERERERDRVGGPQFILKGSETSCLGRAWRVVEMQDEGLRERSFSFSVKVSCVFMRGPQKYSESESRRLEWDLSKLPYLHGSATTVLDTGLSWVEMDGCQGKACP